MSHILRITLIALVILTSALFQVGAASVIFGGYPHFNFFLCLAMALAFGSRFSESLWTAFLGGLFLDFFTSLPFGLTSLLLVMCSYLCRKIYTVLGFRWWVFALVSFISSFLLRWVFGFSSFSWFYFWGALEDVFLGGLIYLFFVPLWEKTCDNGEYYTSLG